MSERQNATEQRIEKLLGWGLVITSAVINVFLVFPVLTLGLPMREPLIRAWRLDRKAEGYVRSADEIKLLKGFVLSNT